MVLTLFNEHAELPFQYLVGCS